MDILYVQFSDETETVIVSWFCCEQSPEYYSYLGEVYADDQRYILFFDNLPDSVKPFLPQPVYP
ncbi:hypothetical protein [Yersinia massiliensis]|uniref:hypothetical protein n=1 Tax=Yersinia massiliensis TaxID=419257 RepID=UPI0011A5743D|nr:hypothetical protein [Yersinia massiliensis]